MLFTIRVLKYTFCLDTGKVTLPIFSLPLKRSIHSLMRMHGKTSSHNEKEGEEIKKPL